MSGLIDHVAGPGDVRIFTSIGCGLAEAEMALVAMHQANPKRQWAWGWLLIDPDPTCFQIRADSEPHMTAPCLPMTLPTLHERPIADWKPWMQQVLLLNWPDRTSQFDFLALRYLKPRAAALVYDACAGSGSAPLHALLASWGAPHSAATVTEANARPQIVRELEAVHTSVELALVHTVALLMKSAWSKPSEPIAATTTDVKEKDDAEAAAAAAAAPMMWNSIAFACVVAQSIVEKPTAFQSVVLDLLRRWTYVDPQLVTLTTADIHANNTAYVAWERAQHPATTSKREADEIAWAVKEKTF